MALKDGVTTITHPMLGKIVAAHAPLATFLSENDDFDLALYPDGADAMLIRLELDYMSRLTGKEMEIMKEFVVGKKYLNAFGRGAYVSKFEEVFDKVATDQLAFIPINKIVEIRRALLTLLEEYFERLDRGDYDNLADA